jgi:hypothetical protein
MRRILLAVPFAVFACSGGESMPADEPATAMAAALTEADVAGTWMGTAMMEGSDSVMSHWTNVCGMGTCQSTSQEDTTTSVLTYTIDGDSAMATGTPMANPEMGGAMVIDHWVARLTGTEVNGTGYMTLADMPDSVVMRYRFTGTKQP